MKDFDLAKAKAGALVCTRDGRQARIICWDAKVTYDGEIYPIIALIGEDEQHIMTYDNNGNIVAGTNGRPEDLVMASVKHEGWVNVYTPSSEGKYIVSAVVYDTEADAKKAGLNKSKSYITTVKIKWEE